jgi:hypothetical protein
MHVFYIFIHSSFGRASYIFGLIFSFGCIEKGSPWLFLFYFSLLTESFVVYMGCKAFPSFEKWIYDTFTYKLVSILCGNTPMRQAGKAIIAGIGYYAARTADGFAADKRVEYGAHAEAEFQKKHQNVDKLPESQLNDIWRKNQERVGPGIIHKVEDKVTSMCLDAFKEAIGSVHNKK